MEKAETAKLVRRAQTGDRSAFEKLYSEYRGRVYFFVRRFAGSGDAAEDLTSETFTAAMERINDLRSGESFAGWLYSIAYKKCVDFLRDESRTVSVKSAAELEELLEAAALNEPILLPEDYAVNAETRAQLREVIDGLSPDMRSAVIMYYYDEMSIPEVAAAMGTNENNVSQKLHRARKKIRTKIEKLIGRGTLFGAVPMGSLLENLSDSGLDMSTAGIGLAAISAAAVAVPYGLSKASGGIAGELLFITRKYWSKHKKSLAALLFSGVLLCAVMTCLFLIARKEFVTRIDNEYDKEGRQTLLVTSDRTDVIDLVTKEDTIRGEIDVLGRTGIGNDTFEYGVLRDPDNLAHLPLESGRLPEKEGELAAFRSVLKTLGFFGNVGDRITLDSGTYTLVGILHDENADYRVGTRLHIQQVYDDVYNEYQKEFRYFFPMLFIGGSSTKTPDYTWVLLDNIKYVTVPDKNRDRSEAFHDEFNDVLEANGIEFETDMDWRYENWEYYPLWSWFETFKDEQRQMMPLYIVSFLIASLSVLAVMRSIFAERENTVRMLRRIGVSKRQIRVMYAIEYLCLAIIQAAAGIALGSAAHFGISEYQTKVMGWKSISGFTVNKYADWLLPDPFVAGAVTSAGVLLAGYILAALLSCTKASSRKRKKAAVLWKCIGRAFRTRTVTVIQIAALTLICFGTVYGYMLFHSTEGYYIENGVGYVLENEEDEGKFVPYLVTVFGNNGQFDFDKDDIEEYYAADGIRTVAAGSFVYSLHSDRFNGIDDTTADTLPGVIPRGVLPQTFILSGKDSRLKSSITFGSVEEKQFFLDNSSDEGRALLSSDRVLYKAPIALTDKEVIEQLSQYVTAGEINTAKLDSGEEILMIVKYGESPLDLGESIQLGAAETENGFGIGKLSTSETRIGAIIMLPKDMDKFLRYSVSAGDDYNLLSTASGAASMGFEGAMYTELFAKEAIGSQIPLGTGFKMTSKAQLRHELFLRNASFLGSMGALVLLMSLLGFSAYFNGIGLKIRLKEYQINIMRAIGAPIKRLRRRLMLDGLRIPLISGIMAFGGVKLMQRIMLSGYEQSEKLLHMASEGYNKLTYAFVGDDYTDEMLAHFEYINGLNYQSDRIRAAYLCDQQMWFMNALVPTLIIFTVMCIITILLTRKSFRRFTPDIAGALARGRKRR